MPNAKRISYFFTNIINFIKKWVIMITLLQNLNCFSPSYLGVKDILIVKDTIYKILEPNSLKNNSLIDNYVDCSGLIGFPGIIDGHVHIIGGGGDSGFSSFNVEISADEIINSGVTTVVGVLGADKDAKNLFELFTKAKALELEGLSTYMYTGNYAVPVKTFTGDITSDLILIDKIIGVGEIAISDERSSHPTAEELIRISSNTYLGGLLGDKAGIVHFHLGDGKSRLSLLNQVLDNTDLPIKMFLPTHVNRNKELFNEAVDYTLKGGYIDLTSGEKIGLSVKEAVFKLIEQGVNLDNVTISSDANASSCCGMAKISSLYKDLIDCINSGIDPSIVLALVTKNVANRLIKNSKLGEIKQGYKANIVIASKDFEIKKVMTNGKFFNKER
jgi:beta-aspartyl-dipeptidase (metallo-type)